MFLPSHFLEAIPKAMANEVGKRDQRSQPWWVGGREGLPQGDGTRLDPTKDFGASWKPRFGAHICVNAKGWMWKDPEASSAAFLSSQGWFPASSFLHPFHVFQ